VGEDETPEDRGHEGIGAALFEEAVDPELEAAVKRELRAEDFVLAEDEEKEADADAQNGERAGIVVLVWTSGDNGSGHQASHGREIFVR